MNKFDLDAMLKAAKTPECPADDCGDISREVLARLRREPKLLRTRPRWFPQLAWGFATAVACLAIVFVTGHWHGETSFKDSLQSAKLIRETLAMFPNRVRAITQDEHGLNLVLSDSDDVPVSTPIYVSICDGKYCTSFVTFSGQEIQVAGQKVTVLSDAQGGIILTGNQFVWSNTDRTYADNRLKIEAKNL
jgi:hypothetical protein